jgi:hypothetical protein
MKAAFDEITAECISVRDDACGNPESKQTY